MGFPHKYNIVVCSCGQMVYEVDVLYCESCGDVMCYECTGDCLDCNRQICTNCQYDIDECKSCHEETMSMVINDVYLIIDNNKYRVQNGDYLLGKIKESDITKNILIFNNKKYHFAYRNMERTGHNKYRWEITYTKEHYYANAF